MLADCIPAIETCYYAPTREIAVEHLQNILDLMGAGGLQLDAAAMVVTLSCGESRSYQRVEDLPAESDECLCGKVPQRHFFVQYGVLDVP